MTSSPSRRRIAGVLGATSAVAALAASMLTAAPASAATTGVYNGNFEATTKGWTVSADAALTRLDSGQLGWHAARVTNKGTAKTVVLNDVTNSVTSTTVGKTYEVSAYVRSTEVGKTVNLRVMEFVGSSLKGQANNALTLNDKAWHKLSLSYKAVTTGAALDLNVLAWKLGTGKSFDVDHIALTTTDSASAPVVVPAPVPDVSTAPVPTIPVPTTPVPTVPVPTVPVPTSPVPAGWALNWADEFNGSTLDGTKWNAENNSTYGDGNNELACLMNRKENIDISGGTLTLRAVKEKAPFKCGSKDARFPGGRAYTSAMLNTRNKASFQYGKFEMRAKLPTQAGSSKGLWPAFWMRPTSGGTGELDIMEAVGSNATGNESNKVHQTIWYDYKGTYKRQATTYSTAAGTNFADAFHTFSVEWEPGAIRWYIDGKLTTTRDRSTTTWLDEAFGAKDKDFYLRLNLAVGGSWPGTPDADTAFPANYEVDYVRVYKRA